MNFCKFLETLKREINSLYHLKISQKPFPTGHHCFWKYRQANSFIEFWRHFRKTSSKQNEIVGKASLTLFRYLYCVSRFYCCSGRVSEGWDKFSSQCTYRRRQRGLRICQLYFKNIKILLRQVNFTKYDYDKCQRKNRNGSFTWTVVAPQWYPKKELLQMFWVFCKKTVMKVWFFLKSYNSVNWVLRKKKYAV